jgi:hypothetical protein
MVGRARIGHDRRRVLRYIRPFGMKKMTPGKAMALLNPIFFFVVFVSSSSVVVVWPYSATEDGGKGTLLINVSSSIYHLYCRDPSFDLNYSPLATKVRYLG